MRKIRGKDTKPEILVRRILHRLGFRFRLHRKNLPGSPDVVLPRWKTVVFVHGCFWHRHQGCDNVRTPISRPEYWLPKFDRNVKRDRRDRAKLRKMGWRVLVIWECELRRPERLTKRITDFFAASRPGC